MHEGTNFTHLGKAYAKMTPYGKCHNRKKLKRTLQEVGTFFMKKHTLSMFGQPSDNKSSSETLSN